MATFPAVGLPIDECEKLLSSHGQHLPPELRDSIVDRIFSAKVAAGMPGPHYLPPVAAVQHANEYARDWSKADPAVNDIGTWCRDFKENSEAVNSVLEYLEAQINMDLFQNNDKAKRVYMSIIRAGIEAVIFKKAST